MAKDKFMFMSKEGGKRKSGARHERRAHEKINREGEKKLAKLMKRYPAEAAEAMRRIEEKKNR